MRSSRSPSATIYVQQLDLCVTVMLLEETPTILSLGNFCEDHGCTFIGASGRKPHLTKKGKRIDCNAPNCSICGSWNISESFLCFAFFYLFIIFIDLMSTDAQKIQYKKEVKIRVKSFGETRCIDNSSQETLTILLDS